MKTKLQLLKLRLNMAKNVLFGHSHSMILIDINNDNLIKLVKGNAVEFKISVYKLHPYLAFKSIKLISSTKDDLDMILDKAQFQADTEIYLKNKQQ